MPHISSKPDHLDFYRLIVQNARDFAIFTLDREGKISSWNPGSERIFGFEENAILGKYGGVIFTEEDQKKGMVEKEMASARQNGRTADIRWHRRQDGSRFWACGSMMALFDDQEEHVGYLKIVQDRTEEKRLQDALEELNANLENRIAERTQKLKQQSRQLQYLVRELIQTEQREKRKLAEILHDDHQQILAAIKLKLDRLSKKADESFQSDFEAISALLMDAITRNRSLTKDLWPPALFKTGLMPSMTWLKEHMHNQHRLNVHITVDDRAAHLDSEEVKIILYQCIRELLFNIVKHAQVDEAHVSVELREGSLVCEVKDNGQGFTPDVEDQQDRVTFGIFSIRERLEIMNGRLHLDSKPGEGTRVELHIPIDPD